MRLIATFAAAWLLLLGSACTKTPDAGNPTPSAPAEPIPPPDPTESSPVTPAPSPDRALSLVPHDAEFLLFVPSISTLAERTGLVKTKGLVPSAFEFLLLPAEAARLGLHEEGFAVIASLNEETLACMAPHRGAESVLKALEERAEEHNTHITVTTSGPHRIIQSPELPNAAVLLDETLAILIRSRNPVSDWPGVLATPGPLGLLQVSDETSQEEESRTPLLSITANVQSLLNAETGPLRAKEHASLRSAREKLQVVLDDPEAKEGARAHWERRVQGEIEWAEETREARNAEADALDALWGGVMAATITVHATEAGLRFALDAPLTKDSLIRRILTEAGAGEARSLPAVGPSAMTGALSLQVAARPTLVGLEHIALALFQQGIPPAWKSALTSHWRGSVLAALTSSPRQWVLEGETPGPVVLLERDPTAGAGGLPTPEMGDLSATEKGWQWGVWPETTPLPDPAARTGAPIAFAIAAPALGLQMKAIQPLRAEAAPSPKSSMAPPSAASGEILRIDQEIAKIRDQIQRVKRTGAEKRAESKFRAFERLGVFHGSARATDGHLRLILEQSKSEGTLAQQLKDIAQPSEGAAGQTAELKRLRDEIRNLNRARNQAERDQSRRRP